MPTPFDDITVEDVVEEEETSVDEEEEDMPEEEEESSQEKQETSVQEDQDQEKEDTPEEDVDEDLEDEDLDSDEDDSGEEDTDEDTEEEVSVIGALQEKVGLQLDNEYSEDLDGAAQFVMDAATEVAQQQINQTFQQFPEVQQFMQFRANGGDPDEYFEVYGRDSWEDVQIREDDQQQQKRVIKNRLQEEGWDDEEIEEAVEEYESSGILHSEARRSLNRLQKLEEQRKEQLVEEQQEKAESQQEEINQLWNEIETTIDESGDLKGLPLPETQKEKFFQYINNPVDEVNGQPVSQRDLDSQEADLEDLLALDYVMFLMNQDGFSLESLIQSEAKSEKASELQRLLDGSSKKKKPKSKSSPPSGDGSSGADVDVDELVGVEGLVS